MFLSLGAPIRVPPGVGEPSPRSLCGHERFEDAVGPPRVSSGKPDAKEGGSMSGPDGVVRVLVGSPRGANLGTGRRWSGWPEDLGNLMAYRPRGQLLGGWGNTTFVLGQPRTS